MTIKADHTYTFSCDFADCTETYTSKTYTDSGPISPAGDDTYYCAKHHPDAFHIFKDADGSIVGIAFGDGETIPVDSLSDDLTLECGTEGAVISFTRRTAAPIVVHAAGDDELPRKSTAYRLTEPAVQVVLALTIDVLIGSRGADNLPDQSILIDNNGVPWEKQSAGATTGKVWYTTGDECAFKSTTISYPARVIRRGENGATE